MRAVWDSTRDQCGVLHFHPGPYEVEFRSSVKPLV